MNDDDMGNHAPFLIFLVPFRYPRAGRIMEIHEYMRNIKCFFVVVLAFSSRGLHRHGFTMLLWRVWRLAAGGGPQ